MKIETLSWDSQFFKFPVGAIRLNDTETIKQLINFKKNSSFKLIYVFLNQPNREKIEAIKKIAPLYDKRVVYTKKNYDYSSLPLNVTQYKGRMTEDLLFLALLSGRHSRFRKDPLLRRWFEKLYTVWIKKSLAGVMADAIYVATIEKALAGFITVTKKTDEGQIGLIAVHPKFRGIGVGSSLLKAAEHWLRVNKKKAVTVITQQENLAACRLYEKNQYKVDTVTAIFHLWTNQPCRVITKNERQS